MYSGVAKMKQASHRKKLGVDAQIIFRLMKKQPRTFQEILKEENEDEIPSVSQVRRVIPLLLELELIIEVPNPKPSSEKLYALFSYTTTEAVVNKLIEEHGGIIEITLDKLAHLVGKSPDSIKDEAYRLAKKHGFRIGSKNSYGRMTDPKKFWETEK